MNKTCVVIFGRFNPIHLGHIKMFQTGRSFCNSTMNTTMKIFVSTSCDTDKNFLPFETKMQMIADCYPEYYQYCQAMPSNSLFATLEGLDDEYDNITVLCGSDRHLNYKNVLEKYNGKLYNFLELKVLNMGERDACPFSSSAMRQAVIDNDFGSFSNCIGSTKFDQKYFEILAECMGKGV